MNELLVGRRVRELRKAKGFTLEALGEQTGFSKSLLSKVETGQVSPPIATLSRIASALDVPISYFFEAEVREDRAIFCAASDRARVDTAQHGPEYSYEHLASGGGMLRLMEPFIITLERDSQDQATLFEHPGEEFIMVLSGEMEFLFGSTSYLMGEGDSLYFDGRVPHGPKQIHGRPVSYLAIFTNR